MRQFQIRWENFRSFEDTGWLEIKPITIVIGANASGKTSLIGPLLMLAQTIESADASLALKTQGDYFNAGSFENLIYSHETDRILTFSICFNLPEEKPNELQPVGSYPPGELRVSFAPTPDQAIPRLQKFEILDVHGRQMVERNLTHDGSYDLVMHPSPSSAGSFEKAVHKTMPSHFLFTIDALFKERYEEEAEKQKSTDQDGKVEIAVEEAERRYLAALAYTGTRVESLLTEIAYIGPLRERPRRFYEVSGETPSKVGTRGQFAPEILFRHRSADKVPPVGHGGPGFVLPLDKPKHLRSAPRLLFHNEGGERLCAALIPDDAGPRVRLVRAGKVAGASEALTKDILNDFAAEMELHTGAEEVHLPGPIVLYAGLE
jgi:hypothetical protein